MEEFLVALGVKKPIRLMVEEDKKVYDNPGRRLEDFIVIRSDTWGYIYLEASVSYTHLDVYKRQVDDCSVVFSELPMYGVTQTTKEMLSGFLNSELCMYIKNA